MRSRMTNFWILPVTVIGNSATYIAQRRSHKLYRIEEVSDLLCSDAFKSYAKYSQLGTSQQTAGNPLIEPLIQVRQSLENDAILVLLGSDRIALLQKPHEGINVARSERA